MSSKNNLNIEMIEQLVNIDTIKKDIEFRKMLNDVYPSNYLKNQISKGDDILNSKKKGTKNKKCDVGGKNTKSKSSPKIPKKNEDKNNNKNKTLEKPNKNKDKKVIETKSKKKGKESDDDSNWTDDDDEDYDTSEYDSCDEDEYEEDDEDDEDYEDEEDDKDEITDSKNGKKLNIFLTIGDPDEEGDWDDYDEDYNSESSSDTEDENESVSSVSSTEDESSEEEEEEEIINKPLTRSKKQITNKTISNKKEDKNVTTSTKENNKVKNTKTKLNSPNTNESSKEKEKRKNNMTSDENQHFINLLKGLTEKTNSNMLKNCLNLCESEVKESQKKREKKNKKQKEKNMRIYRKINKNKEAMNDVRYFNKLEIDAQKKVIGELKNINKVSKVEKPYKLSIIESNIPIELKSTALKKLASLRYMEPGSGEYYKIKNWVDTFMSIPFGKYNELPINLDSDGVDKCHDFMASSQKILDEAVYGLNDSKMQIMQLLGQYITNPKAIGSAIAIHGPPGTGKTSLVKEGISKILNRPFAFLALGGATDSSFLEGHSYTYEGSTWGKIVQILVDSKCMNPVIYFDELDKISETPKGEEIAGILTHLTDTSQNTQFHDKYFSEIDFDLSKCLFIFSYNDESKVNPILKDRMYRIQTSGYSLKQKNVIANNYLLPKIREQVKFNDGDIIIPDESIQYIIDNLAKEDGVRTLKRCLEIIYTKLNLYRLMKPETNLFEEEMTLKVKFPFTVTREVLEKLIKNKDKNTHLYGLYV